MRERLSHYLRQINERTITGNAEDILTLDALQTAVHLAQQNYHYWFQATSSIKLFHHHGDTGQQRARILNERMQGCHTLQEALQLLNDHLDRREGCS